MQPIIRDDHGSPRFKANKIVEALLDQTGGLTLNDLAIRDFPPEDWEQFYQLIGYSLNGYHELSRVRDESALDASKETRKQLNLPEDEVVGCRDMGCPIHSGVS